MQTRKRAKSVTFGKSKEKESTDKEDKASVAVSEKIVASKVETPEPEVITDKTVETEASKKVTQAEHILSAVPTVKKPDETASVITPPKEFLTDTSPTLSEATPETSPQTPVTIPSEGAIQPLQVESVTAEVGEPKVLTPQTPENKTEALSTESVVNEELSSTPPTSAFTIQGNNLPAAGENGGVKQHFALYFMLIAFLAFLMGIGAMAAVTYGFVKIPGINKTDFMPKSIPFLKPAPTTEPTKSVEPPTATPTEKAVDLQAYTISVLNGSGIKGKAAEVKTSLTTAGFKVEATGNAQENDYTTTQIAAKNTVDKAFLAKLETELKKAYKTEPVIVIPEGASGADVVVTLGKTPAE